MQHVVDEIKKTRRTIQMKKKLLVGTKKPQNIATEIYLDNQNVDQVANFSI